MVILINKNWNNKWYLLDSSQSNRIIIANDRDDLEQLGFEKVESGDVLIETVDVYKKKEEKDKG